MRHADRPRSLFKYRTPTELSLTSLASCELWLAAPQTFNDPFDSALHVFRGDLTSQQFARWRDWLRANDPFDDAAEATLLENNEFTPEAQDVVRRAMADAFDSQRTDLLTNCGVCCFSSYNDDLLMWSHYAAGHRGFCIELSCDYEPCNEAKAVRYRTDIPVVDPIDVASRGGDYVDTMMLTKSDCWRYEGEWRLLSRMSNRAISYPREALLAVYLGAAVDHVIATRIRELAATLGAPVRRMTVARDAFRLIVAT